MLLVDTSVWLDFLIGRPTPARFELHRLIATGAPIAVTGTILQEILQGIRSDLEYRQTARYLRAFDYVRLEEPATFIHAAEIYRTCRRRGCVIRKPVDCIIAAQAMGAAAELFHNDRDFAQIAAHVPLKLYPFPA